MTMEPWSWILPKLTKESWEPVLSSLPSQSHPLWSRPRSQSTVLLNGSMLWPVSLCFFSPTSAEKEGEEKAWKGWIEFAGHFCTAFFCA